MLSIDTSVNGVSLRNQIYRRRQVWGVHLLDEYFPSCHLLAHLSLAPLDSREAKPRLSCHLRPLTYLPSPYCLVLWAFTSWGFLCRMLLQARGTKRRLLDRRLCCLAIRLKRKVICPTPDKPGRGNTTLLESLASRGGTKGVDIEGDQYVTGFDRRPSSHMSVSGRCSAHELR